MVELLVVVTLVVCFFLALLDYIPSKYKYIFRLAGKPWFKVLLSLIVAVLSLLLVGVPVVQLILLSLASSFLANALITLFKKA